LTGPVGTDNLDDCWCLVHWSDQLDRLEEL
jgi:hypothetical protein